MRSRQRAGHSTGERAGEVRGEQMDGLPYGGLYYENAAGWEEVERRAPKSSEGADERCYVMWRFRGLWDDPMY
eukprot:scaffold105678_cov32-Tisochrysis_lutea.AAC.7